MLALLGYLLTLAPTITFWDAGEFITAAHGFGIPHPPGTPLFVLLSGVFTHLVPLGAFAWRDNLLSAVCSAGAASCWCVVTRDIVWRLHGDVDARARYWLATLAGVAAALTAAFGYSVWQSATETEVYAGAILLTGLALVAVTRWRATRRSAHSDRWLLFALYCGALAIGDHPMGLLAGGAVVAVLVAVVWHDPQAQPLARHAEWARIGTVAAGWLACIGIALASGVLLVVGGVAMLAAVIASWLTRQRLFAILAVLIVLVGASTELFLLIRARQQPLLNQGNAVTWHALVDVIGRASYPVRTPLDNPTVVHGPANPGRSPTVVLYQVINYVQYFDWQWAASFGELWRASWARLVITLMMIGIGVRGALAQRRGDPASFALIGILFLVGGPLLIAYLNFKPGPSIGWNVWTQLPQHEVRDRDYFFVGSFIAWAIWVAIGLAEMVRSWAPRIAARRRNAVAAVFAVSMVPFACNLHATDRSRGPETTFARDYATALLTSVPRNAILFTWGDNDTFPLWYMQQVEQFRTDVTVICLALTPAPWYIANLRRDDPSLRPLMPGASFDAIVNQVIAIDRGARPIAWSTTATDALAGHAPHLIQQGLALVLPAQRADSTRPGAGSTESADSVPIDLPTTLHLIDRWHFGALERDGDAGLDGNIQALADVVADPMRRAARALQQRGDTARARRLLDRAARITR